MVTDGKSLKQAVSSNNSIYDKRCGVAVATMRRMTEEEKIAITWTEGKLQPADVLTKANANPHLVKEILGKGVLPLDMQHILSRD